MRYTVSINSTVLPDIDVLNITQSERALKFAGSNLIASKITITLSNMEYKYDDRQGTFGFFKDVDWYNWVVTVYDNDLDRQVWYGRLKSYVIDDSKLQNTLTISDYVQDMVDTNCVIALSGKTASEIVYAILTDTALLNIPVSHIIQGGFEEGKTLQVVATMQIVYTAADNQKCISVIEELCRVSESYLYVRDNLISYWQWREYGGVLGTPVHDKDIVPGSYSHETKDDSIFNEFSIAYKNGAAIAHATGSDLASKVKYGSGKIFTMPKDKVESTESDKHKILYETAAGAAYAGALVLSRWKEIKKIAKFAIGYHFNFLNLGDVTDMRFAPYTREPAMITTIKENANRTLAVQAELVNYPPVVSLDLTPPDPVDLLSVFPDSGAVFLKWSKSNDPDTVGYNLYFTSSEGYWRDEVINGAISPKIINISNIEEVDGNLVYLLTGLQDGIQYFFKVSCFDTSYNESAASNILSATPYESNHAVHLNQYMCAGDLFTGVVLAMSNPHAGYLPTGYTHYDDLDYDEETYELTAVYHSWLLHSQTGFSAINLLGSGDPGDVKIQYRLYSNGSFGAWSAEQSGVGPVVLDPGGAKDIQIRALFYSPQWSDSDSLHITEIIEA